MRTIATAWGTFACFEGDAVGNALAEGRFWDAHLKPIMDAAPCDGWAIDLGAYIGFFSVYLAARYQKVLAVEPQPASFDLLIANVLQNRVTQVVCLSRAAYDRETTLRQAVAAEVGWDPLHPTNAPSVPLLPADLGLGLRASPIDPFFDEDPLPVRLIKVDCQGADLRALVGLTRTIRRWRPTIVFEWEEGYAAWHGDDWAAYEQWAAAEGYTVARIVPDYWDFVARPIEAPQVAPQVTA